MTTDESAALMDAVFTSEDLEARYRLLKIIQDFLMSESSKFMAHEKSASYEVFTVVTLWSLMRCLDMAKTKQTKKNVNMEELVGNTTGFADSG